jgi:hypothetical protein
VSQRQRLLLTHRGPPPSRSGTTTRDDHGRFHRRPDGVDLARAGAGRWMQKLFEHLFVSLLKSFEHLLYRRTCVRSNV